MAIRPERIGEYEAEHKAKQWEKLARSAGQLMIANQRINQPGESGPYQDKTTYPKETEGQKLDKKNPTYTEGGIIDTGELDSGGKPLMIKGNPLDDSTLDKTKFRGDARQRKIRNLVDEGATKGEQDAARGKLKDQTQLPNFFKAIIDSKPNPADQLKIILQLLPALTGGGLGQMADSRRRDLMIRQAVGAYGKHPKTGEYIDPAKLLQSLPRA